MMKFKYALGRLARSLFGDSQHRAGERAKVIVWVVYALLLLAFCWKVIPLAIVNQAKFETTYLAPFYQAQQSSDPAEMTALLDKGLAGIRATSYAQGHSITIMVAEPKNDAGLTTAMLVSLRDKAKTLAAMDKSSIAYETGIANLKNQLAIINDDTEVTSPLYLYLGRYAKENGFWAQGVRDGGYAFLFLLVLGGVGAIAAGVGQFFAEEFAEKAWDWADNFAHEQA